MQPLDGIVVIDASQALSGPFATQILADMGADVLKIESPKRGDLTRTLPPTYGEDISAYFASLNRNKESLTLDLTADAGQEVLHDLVAEADVFVQNFGPGAAEELAVDYDTLSAITEDLIYCDISGYGAESPYSDRKAFDIVFQAQSGLLGVTGTEAEPIRIGTSISDVAAAMTATYAVLTALYHRSNTDEGQYIDVSLLDSSFQLLMYHVASFFATGENPRRMGRKHWNVAPYGIFETADAYIAMGVINESMWQSFCAAVDREEWLEDERFEGFYARVKNRDVLDTLVEDRLREKSTDEWLDRLLDHDIPCSAINSVADIVEDPHIEAREMLQTVEHPEHGEFTLIDTPVNFSTLEAGVHTAPPALGEHTDAVLEELGYSVEEIERLRDRGVI
jgi:crotonobetainyl-CoA:carnitine CoA-transferase CaiB-like acyl-CoA transferase